MIAAIGLSKRPRIPHGAAKAIVANLVPNEPVVVRDDYIGGIKSAARLQRVKVTIRRVWRIGRPVYEVMLNQQAEVKL
jgi:hypothetical protein